MAYMSPEQLDWLTTQIDYCAVDVWAFGMVLYVLCAGRLPWASAHDSCPAYVQYTRGHVGCYGNRDGSYDGTLHSNICGAGSEEADDAAAVAWVPPGLESCHAALVELIIHTLDPNASRRWKMDRVCSFLERQFPSASSGDSGAEKGNSTTSTRRLKEKLARQDSCAAA